MILHVFLHTMLLNPSLRTDLHTAVFASRLFAARVLPASPASGTSVEVRFDALRQSSASVTLPVHFDPGARIWTAPSQTLIRFDLHLIMKFGNCLICLIFPAKPRRWGCVCRSPLTCGKVRLWQKTPKPRSSLMVDKFCYLGMRRHWPS